MTKHKEALEALQTQIHQHIELRLEHGYVTANTPEIEAAISALRALQAASWQPISTAPKDRVILIRNKTGTVFSGQWWDEDEGSEGWMMTGQLNLFYDPIEWREMLPAAPVDGGE